MHKSRLSMTEDSVPRIQFIITTIATAIIIDNLCWSINNQKLGRDHGSFIGFPSTPLRYHSPTGHVCHHSFWETWTSWLRITMRAHIDILWCSGILGDWSLTVDDSTTLKKKKKNEHYFTSSSMIALSASMIFGINKLHRQQSATTSAATTPPTIWLCTVATSIDGYRRNGKSVAQSNGGVKKKEKIQRDSCKGR